MTRVFLLVLIVQLMAVMPGSIAPADVPQPVGHPLTMTTDIDGSNVVLWMVNSPSTELELVLADWALSIGVAKEWATRTKFANMIWIIE